MILKNQTKYLEVLVSNVIAHVTTRCDLSEEVCHTHTKRSVKIFFKKNFCWSFSLNQG